LRSRLLAVVQAAEQEEIARQVVETLEPRAAGDVPG
jgi:hypothetical protein